MLEGIVLTTFALAILGCALSGQSVIWALVFGFFLFTGYGLYRGHNVRALAPMAMKGVKTIFGGTTCPCRQYTKDHFQRLMTGLFGFINKITKNCSLTPEIQLSKKILIFQFR